MKVLLILLMSLGLVGCGMTVSSIRQSELPPVYKTDIEDILKHIEHKIPLRYKYSVKVLTESEMNESMKLGSPHIKQVDPNGDSVIYMDDLFLKYLYNHPVWAVYRKLNLTCLIVHEICHREYNLPDKPIEVHFQVDLKAIELLKLLGIQWNEYMGMLTQIDEYIGIRKRGSESTIFLRTLFFASVGLTTGFYYSEIEDDAWQRAMWVESTFTPQEKNWPTRGQKQYKSYIKSKTFWDFPDK